VLSLDPEPEPADGLRRLTDAIDPQWPEAPPYSGAFAEVVPHLTIAHGAGRDVLAEVERAVLQGLCLGGRDVVVEAEEVVRVVAPLDLT
jgi:hypothetical protein